MALRAVFLCITSLTLAGCMNHKTQIYTPMVVQDRSITAAAGGQNGFLGEVKDELRQQGWRIAANRSMRVNRRVDADTTEEADSARTRYQLTTTERQYDWCLDGDRAVNYEAVIIDAQTEEEVLSVSGRGCLSRARREFANALRAITSR